MIRNGTVLSFDTGNYCWVSVVTASTNIRPPRLPLKQRRRLVTSMSKLIRYRFASDSLSRLDSSSYTHSACPDPVTRVSDDGRSADMELLRGCIYEFHSWTSLAAWHERQDWNGYKTRDSVNLHNRPIAFTALY